MFIISSAASPVAFNVLILAWTIFRRSSIRSMSTANLKLFSWHPCMEIPVSLSRSPSITLSRYVMEVVGDNGSPCRDPIDDVNHSPMHVLSDANGKLACSPMTWSIFVNRLPTPYDFIVAHVRLCLTESKAFGSLWSSCKQFTLILTIVHSASYHPENVLLACIGCVYLLQGATVPQNMPNNRSEEELLGQL